MWEKKGIARGTIKQPSNAMRWFSIVVRTCHIGVGAVFFGGCVLHVPFAQLALWHHLAIVTGGGLLLLELLHDMHWPFQGKGLLCLLHVFLGVMIHLKPDLTVPLLWAILISGCIGSHMSRHFRHWSILHGWEVREKTEKRR
jgi:hypothetical protein